MTAQNQTIKALLEDASNKAVMHMVMMKTFYAQLNLLDKKTRIICSRFLNENRMEPVERELLSEELYTIQVTRTKVVEEIMHKSETLGT